MTGAPEEEVLEADPRLPEKPGKKFLMVLLIYTVYLVLGAFTFMYLEFSVQKEIQVNDLPKWLEIKKSLFHEHHPDGYPHTLTPEAANQVAWLELLCPQLNRSMLLTLFQEDNIFENAAEVEKKCDKVRNVTVSEEVVYSWSFIDALYFSMTVTTTIGYGHIAPTRAAGKLMCMMYAVVGIPLTGILLAYTSDVFGEKIFAIYRSKLSGQKQRSRFFIVAATVLYLLLGFVVFLFLPAIVFVYVEGWNYLDSVYYAFITLTTIGFGDIVSGRGMEPGWGHACYQLFVIVWIITSLGYWVMVANFITRALRSKKLHMSLIHRAKLLKDIMEKQNDPVFLPQKSKHAFNFMMQLSSILAVDAENAKQLQLEDPGATPGLSDKSLSSSMPMGIPGISSLFNMSAISPTSMNNQLCRSMVSTVPGGGSECSLKAEHPVNPSYPPSPSSVTNSLDTTNSTITIDCDDSTISSDPAI